MKSQMILVSMLACIGVIAGTTTRATMAPTPAMMSPSESEAENTEEFTPEWRDLFSEKQLSNHLKWHLDGDQPEDGSFQVRTYPKHWITKSRKDCRTGMDATREGYMDLHFFFNGFNYLNNVYKLTYPIMIVVDGRPQPKPKPKKPTPIPKKPKKRNNKRWQRRNKPKGAKTTMSTTEGTTTPMTTPVPCPVRYVTQFYLPIPVNKWAPLNENTAVSSFKRPEKSYYVREYSGNTTTEYCDTQAKQFSFQLRKMGKRFIRKFWICARYEPPAGTTEPKLEVWIQKIKKRVPAKPTVPTVPAKPTVPT